MMTAYRATLIPSQLKAWIDCLAAPGKTFKHAATGVEGLAGGKKLIIASSRGGFYTASSPRAFMDHQETLLTSFLGFIGISDAAFVRAEGSASALNSASLHWKPLWPRSRP
jgi:FMN-dependent NADH-azoreductase